MRASKSTAKGRKPRRARRSSGRTTSTRTTTGSGRCSAPGHTQVDFEERVNFRRLHDYRLARARAALARSGLGALLSLRPAQHPLHHEHRDRRVGARQADALFAAHRQRRPVHLGFRQRGQAPPPARAVAASSIIARPGCWALRGATGSDITLFRDAASEIKAILDAEGVGDMPLGLDVVEPPMLFELQKLGIEVRDGQQVMLQAREVKNIDELTLLNMAAAMVDGVYQDIAEALKPGVKESRDRRARDRAALRDGLRLRRGDQLDLGRALLAASAQLHRPPDPPGRPGVLRRHPVVHGLSHLLLPHVQRRPRDARRSAPPTARRANGWTRAIELLKPGVTHRQDRARSFPQAKDIGFASEMEAFGLNFCHGLGLGLHERPLISRLNSLKEPIELKAGMVFAVETYCPATDGISAARIEEEVILTPDGAEDHLALSGGRAADRQPVLIPP